MTIDQPAHAVFSPSAAHRWMQCPASIRMSKGVPYTPSKYADEGSAAHALAALCFDTDKWPQDFVGHHFNINETTTFVVDDDMAEHTSTFVEFVRILADTGYTLAHEQRLDLSHLYPGQFGTGDAILYDNNTSHLVIADFKYGVGIPVRPDNNPQLLAYASGAAQPYLDLDNLKVTLVIVQPRAPALLPIRHWNTTRERLSEFEGEFRTAVARALNPTSPLVAGQHCKFCPAAAVCPALEAHNMCIAKADFAAFATTNADATSNAVAMPESSTPIDLPDPATLTPEHLGQILHNAELLAFWIEEVRAYATRQALAGNPPKGFKAVAKNTHRKWIDDEDQVLATLKKQFKLKADTVYAAPKLKSPAQIEKLVGKSRAALLADLIVRPQGEPTLAPLEDPRPALTIDPQTEFKQLSTQLTLSASSTIT
jgi:predicted pyridoxine 5'-phosphate oxidase superfamily flavin-nucleotide-binding protein